ncbi:MAG: magnesium/cobalt transporter CorA [Candidatus Thorarchaeota archaeon]|jgi:magnesium transporter
MSQNDITEKVGLPPGTVVHTGIERAEKVTISVMEFSEGQMREYIADSMDDCSPPLDKKAIKWVHVLGVHDVDIVKTVSEYYDLHSLVIEDIPSVGQRPKLEAMPKSVYIVLREYDLQHEGGQLHSEQVSVVFGKNFVLSFQESSDDIFEPIRKRARHQGSRIRSSGTDYLAYAILDLLVDKYFLVLERIGDMIEGLEDELIEQATSDMLNRIYKIKRDLLSFRRHIWPLREVVLKMQRDATSLVDQETHVFLRDLYDHVIRVTDHVETYRESITGMLDIYLSSVNNKMNAVMKVLTVVSTIFIPLTLMASIYGMNWQWIPEIEFLGSTGYPVFLAAMFMVTIILVMYFRRIDWI